MVVGLKDPFDRTVVSGPDLLALSGCSDLAGLSAMVDGESEADMWVAAVEGGIEVGAGGSSDGPQLSVRPRGVLARCGRGRSGAS